MDGNPIIIQGIKEINLISREPCAIQTLNKDYYVLSCRLEGESLFSYEGKTITINRGDILFIPFGSSYSQSTNGEKVVYIHTDICNSYFSKLHIYRAKSDKEADTIVKLFSKIVFVWNEKKSNYYYRCMAFVYNIISNYNAIPFSVGDDASSTLLPAVKYIDENFQNSDFSLEAACKAAHISRTYFNKLFKASYGITPTEYINKMKLSRAKCLLKNKSYTRNEIALLCGFDDVKYFYTFFKKQTGMTPNQYDRDYCQ